MANQNPEAVKQLERIRSQEREIANQKHDALSRELALQEEINRIHSKSLPADKVQLREPRS